MRIVYFYQYFSTPKGSWGTRVYEFASEWVKQGHEVTVVSGIYSKSDLKAEKFIENQVHSGINVKVVNIKIDNKQSFLKRIWTFIQFSLVSCWYALTLKADVVVASSGPITVGIPGLVARYLRGRKLVFETRDLWPEGAIELGILKNRTLQKVAYWFEKRCYRASSLIVALSPGMKTNIEERVGHPNVISVTNAANLPLFSNQQPLPQHFGLTRGTYAIYTGNIGEVNNSYWLYRAAVLLKERGRGDIPILLVGEGQQREELEELARTNKVDNFIRLGLMPKQDLVPLVQNAMVSLVPLKGTPVLDTSSPNKFFESLAAGVPVVQNTQGWMKDFLKEHEVGYTLNPNQPEELADLMIRLKDNPGETSAMRQRSFEIAQKYFDKDYLAEKMLKSIEAIV
ncbi:MAG: glycosyltransferase family 4 protein [Owenweeksia sp.]